MRMRPEDVRARYAKTKRRAVRLWVSLAACAGALLLLAALREKYPQSGGISIACALLAFAVIVLTVAARFVNRCPCCGMPFGLQLPLFQWVFPRKCRYCHTDLETGEAAPPKDGRQAGKPDD